MIGLPLACPPHPDRTARNPAPVPYQHLHWTDADYRAEPIGAGLAGRPFGEWRRSAAPDLRKLSAVPERLVKEYMAIAGIKAESDPVARSRRATSA